MSMHDVSSLTNTAIAHDSPKAAWTDTVLAADSLSGLQEEFASQATVEEVFCGPRRCVGGGLDLIGFS